MISIDIHRMMRMMSREEVGRRGRDRAVLILSFCIKRSQSTLSKYDGSKLHFSTELGFRRVIKKEKQDQK